MEKNRIGKGLLIALTVFIFNFLQIFQGVDLTDEGLFLINQWRSFPIPTITDSIYGQSTMFVTNYLGGMWLKLVAGNELVWARFGVTIVLALTAFFAYWSISEYFPYKKAFFPSITGFIFLSSLYPKYINYESAPALFIAIFCFFLFCGCLKNRSQ